MARVRGSEVGQSSRTSRSAKGKGKQPPQGRKGKRKLPDADCRNPDFEPRFESMRSRPLHLERGINLQALEATFVPGAVMDRGWEHFVRDPNHANESIVREFYASMIPERFYSGRPVVVRGTRVYITAAAINEHFHTANENLPWGYEYHEMFNVDHSPELASALRANGSDDWDAGDHPLLSKELHLDAAFWNLFFSFSLRPTKHRSSIFMDMARLLYNVRNNHRIDIGEMIRQEIHHAGLRPDKILPFPCLISHFCAMHGVDTFGPNESTTAPMSPIGVRAYNDLLRLRGLPMLPTAGSRKRARQAAAEEDDSDEPEDQEPDAGAVGPATYSQRPPWADEIVGAIQGLSLQLDEHRHHFDGRLNRVDGRLDDLTERVDGLQQSMADRGFGQTYMRRGVRGPSDQSGPSQ